MTDEIDYRQEEPFPPSIEARASEVSHPLNQVIILDANRNPEVLSEETKLEFDVREPNLGQKLFYKIFVDFEAFPAAAGEWPGSDDLETRHELFLSNSENFSAPGCHRIELFVTGGFDGLLPRGTVEDDDFGTAVWWLYTITPESPETFDPAECPGE